MRVFLACPRYLAGTRRLTSRPPGTVLGTPRCIYRPVFKDDSEWLGEPYSFRCVGRLRARYRVVRDTPSSPATSVTDCFGSSRSRRAFAIFLLSSFRGLPPVRPRARAEANPAMVRSRINSRSNSANAPKMWKTRRPPADVVSRFSVRLLNPIPWASRSVTVSIRCLRLRPSRSRRHTTRVSPGRRIVRACAHPGRSVADPLMRSSSTRSQPALCRASRWSSRFCS
jgi:hypothetical protein